LQETAARHEKTPSLFYDEGVVGVYRNDFGVNDVRDIASAFGVYVASLESNETGPPNAISHSNHSNHSNRSNAVVLAGDGRPITAEIVAAASEGLRWAGCPVVDIGSATAACLVSAVTSSKARGGLLVGNPGQEPHVVGLKFWTAGGHPLSLGGSLEPVIALHRNGVHRPTRIFGDIERCQADGPYLESLASHYHGLRPLRVVLDSASISFTKYFDHLTASTACSVVPCRVIRSELPTQVREDKAHFAACVDGDGETCRILDDQGREVSPEALMWLLIRHLAAHGFVDEHNTPKNTTSNVSKTLVVLEHGDSPSEASRWLLQGVSQLGIGVVFSRPYRSEMASAMRQHAALLGGGGSGRFWYPAAQESFSPQEMSIPDNTCARGDAGNGYVPQLDALMTLTTLLEILSRDDTPLSALLDHKSVLG
jgi:phosphomannomutase